MKEIDELILPDNVRFTKDHEWAQIEQDLIRIGISDYAQDRLGDIVFVELPEVGSTFAHGQEFGTVESVKAVSELYMPLAGDVVEINAQLEDDPELVNNDPYGGGWMILVKPADTAAYDGLLDRKAYLAILEE